MVPNTATYREDFRLNAEADFYLDLGPGASAAAADEVPYGALSPLSSQRLRKAPLF